MGHSVMSILIISPDEALRKTIRNALPETDFSITEKERSFVELNGSAGPLALRHDLVIFDAEEIDASAQAAIHTLSENRAPNAILIGVAHSDLPLTKVRELHRAGVDDILLRDTLDSEVAEVIKSWQSRRQAQLPALWNGHGLEGKVIAVAKARGGVGASTFAVNLADALLNKRGFFNKKAHNEVTIVDLDFQFGSIAALTDVDESDALWRMAVEETVPDDVFLDQALTKSEVGFSVLTAPSRYGPITAMTPEQIGLIIDLLRKRNDYVVIDLPHVLVNWIEPVLTRCDKLFLATDTSVTSIRAARKLIDFYIGEHPALDIEMVVTQERKPIIPASHHRAAAELLERPLAHWVPRDERWAREALDRGTPLLELAPRSVASKAIRSIARNMCSALPPRTGTHH